MFSSNSKDTLWQQKAKRVGYRVWKNHNLYTASDEIIEAAFRDLAEKYGISYVWTLKQ